MKRGGELYYVSVVPDKLSDGSIAYNVEQTHADGVLVFACENKAHAENLAASLQRCSWVEFRK